MDAMIEMFYDGIASEVSSYDRSSFDTGFTQYIEDWSTFAPVGQNNREAEP